MEQFDRPTWLHGTVYEQLKSMDEGNLKFTYFVQCLDRSKWLKNIKTTGSYTCFAPIDSTFEEYLSVHGYNSVADMSQETVDSIVEGSILCTGYNKFYIDQSGTASGGWLNAQTFGNKYRSMTIFKSPVKLEDYSSVSTGWSQFGPVLVAPNSEKTINFFTDKFQANVKMQPSDYQYLFQNHHPSPMGEFNVLEAQVVQYNIVAENGYIHAVDKVLTARDNIYEIISNDPNYSLFKQLIDKLIYPVYDYASTVLYNNGGLSPKVYIKTFYDPASGKKMLEFDPCDEKSAKVTLDREYEGFSSAMFIPNNEALQQFFDETFLVNYKTIDQVPNNVVAQFINGLVITDLKNAYPSKFSGMINAYGEELGYSTDKIVKVEYGSNGVFYGTSKVYAPSQFSTVISFAYLQDNYDMFNWYFENSGQKSVLGDLKKRFTILAVPDQTFNALGISIDRSANGDLQIYRIDAITKNRISAKEEFLRLCALHIIPWKEQDGAYLPVDLSTAGYTSSLNGEYIKYKTNSVWGTGDWEANNIGVATSGAPEVTQTGIVNKVNSTIKFSDNSIATQLYDSISSANVKLYGANLYTGGANYNAFRRLLIEAEVINGFLDPKYMSQCAFTPDFLDTDDYTCLAPTNAAILAEKSRPGGSRIPARNPADGNKALKEYLKYYFVKKNVIWTTDHISSANYVTANGQTLNISVQNGKIEITDKMGGTATTDNPACVTDVMAKGGNIHQINNVLNFK